MQTALSSMNAAFAPEKLEGLYEARDAFSLADGASLADSLRRLDLGLDDDVLSYLERWPTALQAAVKAIIGENLNREVTVPITFAWQPGYDYSITVHDVYDTPETRGGITIVFTSRYPRDEHPLSVSRS